MNIQSFSKQLLEEALSTGCITLENGETRELKTSEILGIAKYVMSNGIVNEDTVEKEPSNIPTDMFTSLSNDPLPFTGIYKQIADKLAKDISNDTSLS